MGKKDQFAYYNSKLLFFHCTEIVINMTPIAIISINIAINVNGNLNIVNGNLDVVNGNLGLVNGNLGAMKKQQIAVIISILLFFDKNSKLLFFLLEN